jgi:hypothetical protein
MRVKNVYIFGSSTESFSMWDLRIGCFDALYLFSDRQNTSNQINFVANSTVHIYSTIIQKNKQGKGM